MTIEENMSDDKNKDERVKTEKTAKANGIECPKLRVNNDICYCDRAPGSSRSIAAKPHLKASYCVETESNKAITVMTAAAAAAAVDAAANKSNEKATRDSSSSDKLSPVARDFGARNKTTRSQDAVRSDDIFTISRESFVGPPGAKSRLEKSIFSCVSSPVGKTKPSTVIIEELPSDEAYQKPANSSKTAKVEMKKETNLIKEKNTVTMKSYANNNKESISLDKEGETKMSLTPSKIQAADKCEKSRKTINFSKTTVEIKRKTKEEKNTPLSKESKVDKNKKLISSEKEGKTKASTSDKIIANECRKDSKWEMNLQVQFQILDIYIYIFWIYNFVFFFMYQNSQIIIEVIAKNSTCCKPYNKIKSI